MKGELKLTLETKMAIAQAITQALDNRQQHAGKKAQTQWIEVAPHGLVGGMMPNICLMVFRNKLGDKKFAISLSPLQGEIAVQQGTSKEEPFRFITELLGTLKIKVSKCYFLEYDKGHIKTEVELEGHSHLSSLMINASDIIPFAIYSGCQFFCTDKFIQEAQNQKIESTIEKDTGHKPDYFN